MKLSGIVETAIYTNDLEAMAEFYEDKLGLERISYTPNQSLFFRIKHSVLLIFNRDYCVDQTATINGSLIPPHATVGQGHMAFEANPGEYQDRKDQIIALGINIESEVTWPNAKKSFYFRDPSHNSIEIVEHGLWQQR